VVEAVRQAQAARDWPHAARLLADSCLGLILDGRTATVRGLLAAFPPDAVEACPELAVAFAKSRLHDGRLDESAASIAEAHGSGADPVVAGASPQRHAPPLREPLSDAELRVVRYLSRAT
jgi:ATP/maltotriose-dependent transcriptional regulator MalT